MNIHKNYREFNVILRSGYVTINKKRIVGGISPITVKFFIVSGKQASNSYKSNYLSLDMSTSLNK